MFKLIARLGQIMQRVFWRAVYEGYRSKYAIKQSFRFNGVHILLYGDGEIIFGSDSYIGGFSTVNAGNDNKVVVGDRCSISHNVRIYTQTADADSDFSKPIKSTKSGDVVIGDYCWIGANVFINPGIEIGSNSVVGANSVVTKNIPQGEIWGGVPARLIRKKLDFIK